MSEEVVTPNDAPGAGTETVASPPAVQPEPAQAKADTPKPTDTVEFWKLKAREWEDRSKSNHGDAQKWRDLLDKAGADGKDDYDPRVDIDNLRKDIASERRERLRADIAREKNVNPRWVLGDTADEMRDAADAYLADVAASTPKAAPAAAPAAEVTSDKKVEGAKKLSPADVKSLDPADIVAAYRDGRIDVDGSNQT